MYNISTLPNGLSLISSHMPHTHSLSVIFFIGIGSRYESNPVSGLSHFIEHLCFKGTSKRPRSRDISEVVESVGGTINGGTDKEMTIYWCRVPKQHFALALDVLSARYRAGTQESIFEFSDDSCYGDGGDSGRDSRISQIDERGAYML